MAKRLYHKYPPALSFFQDNFYKERYLLKNKFYFNINRHLKGNVFLHKLIEKVDFFNYQSGLVASGSQGLRCKRLRIWEENVV